MAGNRLSRRIGAVVGLAICTGFLPPCVAAPHGAGPPAPKPGDKERLEPLPRPTPFANSRVQNPGDQELQCSKPLLAIPNASDFGFLPHKDDALTRAAPLRLLIDKGRPAVATPADTASPEIVLDGTLGPAGPVRPINGVYTINSNQGQIRGPNLFQSFSQFNLSAGETANFCGPVSVQNVLARVTGGSSSNIDGTLQCTIPGATFYLINPSGVIFGPNASLDLQGGFCVTTADYVKLADGGIFHASSPASGVLTSAAPSAFGFVSQTPAPITVGQIGELGSSATREPILAPAPGGALFVVGGDITIVGGELASAGGSAVIASVASSGEVRLTPSMSAPIDASTFSRMGTVSISQGGLLGSDGSVGSVVGTGSGDAYVAAGPINVNGSGASAGLTSFLGSQAPFENFAGATTILATGTINITNGAIVGSLAPPGPGGAGPITISAASINVDGSGSSLISRGGVVGVATVTVSGALTMTAGGFVGSDDTNGTESASAVNVVAGSISVDGIDPRSNSRSQLGSRSDFFTNAGPVAINASGPVNVSGGGFIGSLASIAYSDMVRVSAPTVTVDGQGSTLGSRGYLGGWYVYLNLNAGALAVTHGGFVGSDSEDVVGDLSLNSVGRAAKDVTISAGRITVDGLGSEISSRAATGNSGSVFIQSSDTVGVTNGAAISTVGTGGGGISINANTLEVGAGASIASVASGSQSGGPVSLNATDISLGGNPQTGWASIYTLVTGTGAQSGGSVTIQAGQISETGLAAIGSGSFGSGARGSLTINAASIIRDADASAPHVSIDTPSGGSMVLTGPQYQIPSTAGQAIGGNFFESFSHLSLAPFESLVLSTPSSASNAIIRVTGAPSTLAGPVQIVGGSRQNLYLMNPAGIAFWGAATVQAPGSIALTTADYITLADSGRFDALVPSQSILTAGDVFGFGFTSSKPASLSVQAGAISGAPAIELAAGSRLMVLAGAINVSGGEVASTDTGTAIFAAVSSPGEVKISSGTIDSSSFANLGSINVTNGGFVGSRSLSGVSGPVWVTANTIIIDGSNNQVPSELASAGGTAGPVTVNASGAVSVTNGGFLGSDGGSAGAVTIVAASISVDGSTLLTNSPLANSELATRASNPLGTAGPLNITASGALSVTNGGFLGSDAPYYGVNSGPVTVKAANVTIDGAILLTPGPFGYQFYNSQLASQSGSGAAGSVQITASGAVTVTNGAFLGSAAPYYGTNSASVTVNAASLTVSNSASIQSVAPATGVAGQIQINAAQILLDGQNSAVSTGVFVSGPLSASLPASGWDLSINAIQSLTVTNGASIAADSFASTHAGSISLTSPTLILNNDASISARSFNGGVGGEIQVNASGGDITLTDKSFISADNYQGSGVAGKIDITAQALSLDGGSSIAATGGGGLAQNFTVTATSGATPNGSFNYGNLFLVSPAGTRIQLDNVFGQRTTQTYDDNSYYYSGHPIGFLSQFVAKDLDGQWTLVMNGASTVTLEGWSLSLGGTPIAQSSDVPKAGTNFSSTLTVSNVDPGLTSGNGGDININARTLSVYNGSTISTTTLGTGSAGNLNIIANTITVNGAGSAIQSQTAAPPFGKLTSQAGNAGSIVVTANQGLMLQAGGAVSATAMTSKGGDITISAPSVTLANGSSISANAFQAGRINITTPSLSLSGGSSVTTNTFQRSLGETSDVAINTSSLSLDNSAISATTSGSSTGGNVLVNPWETAGLLSASLTDGSTISAEASGGSTGAGGNITIDPTAFSMSASQITASSSGSGRGGNVSITSRGGLNVGGTSSISATGNSHAGNVSLIASGHLSISESNVETSAGKTGDGGNITLGSRQSDMSVRHAKIDATAGQQANVTMAAPDIVRIDSSTIDAAATNPGNTGGGRVKIDPEIVLLKNSIINASSNGATVPVVFGPDVPVLRSNTTILTRQLVLSPTVDLAGGLTPLPSGLLSATAKLEPQCTLMVGGQFSSFIVTGREGQPPEPGGLISDMDWPIEVLH